MYRSVLSSKRTARGAQARQLECSQPTARLGHRHALQFHVEFRAGPALLFVNDLSFLPGNGCGQDIMPIFDMELEIFLLLCVLMT